MLPRPSTSYLPSSADISGLLDGLGADDFTDDLDDPQSSQRSQCNSSSPEHLNLSPQHDEFYQPPAPAPETIPSTVGFATAAGRRLAPPSEAAMSRALKLVRAAERDAELEDAPSKRQRTESPKAQPSSGQVPESPLVGRGFGMASGRPAPDHSEAARARALALFGEDTPVKPPARTLGFQFGSGSAVPPTPASARARALAMFGEGTPTKPASGFQMGTGSSAPPQPPDARARALAMFGEQTPVKPSPGFQLGNGSNGPPLPPDARARAPALFGGDVGPSTSAVSGFQTGSGKPTQAPKAESLAFAMALLADEAPIPANPLQRAASPAFAAPRSTTSFGTPTPTPSRAPLATMTNTFSNPMSTPKLPRRIEIQTPGTTPRRIGLGATFGSARGKPKKGFVTPFKRGAAQSAPAPSTLRNPLSLHTPAKPPPEPAKIYKSVFDLSPPPDRKGMREAYLYPGFYTPTELAESGLPDEIWTLNLTNAVYYQFIAEDARVLGTSQALEQLKVVGCELATQKWVDNHWRLILWKVSGQVMAQPKLFDEKWNWYEVLCQLRYRYEREYGAAQRPIIRRIQEHDSSPSLPMVLCVAAIHRPEPVVNERDEPVPQRPYLDVTDGWYIMRALLDDCLTRALSKGKIRVGRKLGLSGAKLESGADGADVLEAYDKSHLVLSGNSTHLAKWDARLGIQRLPFIAGLSSLSVDGGPIVLVDIVLERVYPLAYVNADRGSRESPWGEEEENQRSDAWRDMYEAESTRLREEMQKSLEKIQELASILASHAEDVGAIPPGSPPDVEAEFDALMEARDIMGRLRGLSPTKIVHLATYARQRAMAEAEAGRAEVEAQLSATCPTRSIRDFRMVRVRDGREGDKQQARVAMLNVWDAKVLGNELKEGRRFLVSSLVPGRSGDWSPPKPGKIREVYLHTRRDTRWQPAEDT